MDHKIPFNENDPMITFAYPHIIWLLTAIPAALTLFILYLRWRKRKLMLLGNDQVLQKVVSGADTYHGHLKFILQLIVFALLVLAVARPQIAGKSQRQMVTGGDVVVCLDVSNSMLAEDIRPNRLVRARQAIGTLVRQLDREQVGLVVFAGEAYIQVPLTTDRTAMLMLLNTITAGDISNQGTAIADAISLAVRAFPQEQQGRGGRTIILVTDGEDHEGSVSEEATLAASFGITIHTLGVGDPAGAPLPVYQQGVLTGYLKDAQGNTVISSLDPTILQRTAEVTGGKFFLSDNLSQAMQQIKSEIRKQKPGDRRLSLDEEADDQFHWFAGGALLLLAFERMIPYRRNKRRIIDLITINNRQ
jgi:Ca-activated chloride channel homolog